MSGGAREPLRRVVGRTVVLPQADIDTDQIVPARFLKGVARDGLGAHLFADWRRGPDGQPRPDFPLNQAAAAGAAVLVAGRNFGCGSSREHAPWALLDAGFRAVVAPEIADIFASNALKNALLPVVVDAAAHARLLAAPNAQVVIDVEAQRLRLEGDGLEAPFALEPFARYRLLHGLDELDYLLAQDAAIAAYERAHPWPP